MVNTGAHYTERMKTVERDIKELYSRTLIPILYYMH